MGWGSASGIMNTVIDVVKLHVKDREARQSIYEPIIDILEEGDWDTQDESLGLDEAFDDLMKERHPHWFEGEDE